MKRPEWRFKQHLIAPLLVLMFGCGDNVDAPTEPQRATRPDASLAQVAPGDSQILALARSIAFALQNSVTARVALAEAFAASPWSEGKLILQEYLSSASARELLEGMEASPGMTQEAIRLALSTLPPLDFYLPFPKHREFWNGAVPAGVLAAMNPNTKPFPGFASTGEPISYMVDVDPAPLAPTVALHAAEPKLPRRDQPRRPGRSDIDPLHIPSSSYTYLHWVKNLTNADGVGGAELWIDFYFRDAEATTYEHNDYQVDLCAGCEVDDIHLALFAHRLPDSSRIYVFINYQDQDPGGSKESLGTVNAYWDDNDQVVNIWNGGSHKGQVELVWTARNPQQIDTMIVPTFIQFEEGTTEYVTVRLEDQYGYHIPFTDPNNPAADITSASIEDTWVATLGTIGETTNASIPVDGVEQGTTELYITATHRTSWTDTVAVYVTECIGQFCPESTRRPRLRGRDGIKLP